MTKAFYSSYIYAQVQVHTHDCLCPNHRPGVRCVHVYIFIEKATVQENQKLDANFYVFLFSPKFTV